MVTLDEAYRLLGLTPSATEKEVRKAYRAKVRAVHPDLAGDTEENHQRMVALNRAVERIEQASAAERMLLVNGWGGNGERRTAQETATVQDLLNDLLGGQTSAWYTTFTEQMRQAEATKAAAARATVTAPPAQQGPERERPMDVGPDQEWVGHMACPTCGRGVMAQGRGPLLFKTTELNGLEHQCPTGKAAPYVPRHQRRRQGRGR